MSTALFSTTYLGPISYYRHWRANDFRWMECHEHYLKQTWRNRCVIATANGPMTLSIPVESNHGRGIRDIRISDHGNWRHLHWNSLASAYNSSPFFEYYADDFHPFFEKKIDFLFDLNEQLRITLCDLLQISADVHYTETYQAPGDALDVEDLRACFHPKKQPDPEAQEPYYQVFQSKFGFIPNLSVLDLLFNMGPESILYL
jgi:hypothetical protein